MAQGRKGKLNYRCPRCLMREIDMDMLFDAAKNEYYCLRCSFHGDEAEVQRLNAQFRAKYADRARRITSL
jgi:DNA-directed RNA polymerase subunit RPC12/RpoP